MSKQPPPSKSSAIRSWRAQVWAWVLFAALLKGLVPHAALASLAMSGDPLLTWCAPGSKAGRGEQPATGQAIAQVHCVCASMADGALPVPVLSPSLVPSDPGSGLLSQTLDTRSSARLLPPVRGPPSL